MRLFHALFLIAMALGAIYALWFCFLAVMSLKRAKDAGLLNRTSTALGVPVLLVGYGLDCFCNVVVMTVLLMEWPRETTVTARLKRHVVFGSGWRQRLARWFIPLLDPFDPSGKHITD